jgi:hypothetical protein
MNFSLRGPDRPAQALAFVFEPQRHQDTKETQF